MIPALLSAMYGASLALLGLWYVSRRDARLMDVRSKGVPVHETRGDRRRPRLRRPAAVGASALGWLVLGRGLPGPWPLILSLPPLALFAGWLLDRQARARRLAQMKSEWPVLLETVAACALSGLDLNAAFVAASRRVEGPLREETDRVALRLAAGAPLSRALGGVAKAGIPGADRLSATLLQCEVLGTPVAATLDGLALESSVLQRQEIEARFNALPLKMSLVTVFLLLPPVLVVSIAPHILLFLNSQW